VWAVGGVRERGVSIFGDFAGGCVKFVLRGSWFGGAGTKVVA
jgi:hypothetical protein